MELGTNFGTRFSRGSGSIGYLGPMPNESLIVEADRRLSEAAPDARVILFGSHARGDARPGSDLDLLVVEPQLKSRRAEFVRLREALGAMGVPIDLIVVSSEHAEEWGPVPGTLMHEALRDGRVSRELEPGELAPILARKASEDAVALREFEGNAEIADSILGFHAKQAIEKWLKAVLAKHSVEFEYTHDLRRLIELIEDTGLAFPLETPAIVPFTEFAVPLRYEDLLDAEPLDRHAAGAIVTEVETWARRVLDEADG